ncbi:MAG: thioredoxin family protein [Thiohalomonadaceae bacterium]
MRRLAKISIIALGLAMMASFLPSFAEDGYKFVQLEHTRDFAAAGSENRQQGRAMLLMFSGAHCRYCHAIEEDFLKPMLRSGEYDALISMHKIDLYSDDEVVGFDGQPIRIPELARRYEVFVMPTLLFVDDQGREVGERRIGLTTPGLYGGYLDASIQAAVSAVRRQGTQQISLLRE